MANSLSDEVLLRQLPILTSLGVLSRNFNDKAEQEAEIAKTLKTAAEELKAGQLQIKDLERQIAALKQKTPDCLDNLKGEGLTVLIDNAGWGTPRERAFKATLDLSKSGVALQAAFWGSSVFPIPLEDAGVEKNIYKLSDSAGAFGPANYDALLYCLNKTTLVADQPQHFVIISGGGIGGRTVGTLLAKTLEFLHANPTVTLDFIVMAEDTSWQRDMEKLAQSMMKELPAQISLRVAKVHDCYSGSEDHRDNVKNVTAALKEIAAARSSGPKKQAPASYSDFGYDYGSTPY